MISSFGDRATEALFRGSGSRRARGYPVGIRRTALRKLDMLDAAAILGDLRALPGNRLEALRGDLEGLHSVRVNRQWRIVFRWTPFGPAEVRLVDDHS